MENDTSLALLRAAGLYRAGEERQHRVSNRGRPLTSHVEEKVMEFLEAIVEGMRTRSAAAIAQIPFETVRNWLSKNDPAFRPDFFRAFEGQGNRGPQKHQKAQCSQGLEGSSLLA
jgi:hypothetical protein